MASTQDKKTDLPGALVSEIVPQRKNLGRVWHAYKIIRTAGRFYKLQLTRVAYRHFTQSELKMWACSGTTSYWKGSRAVFN